MTVTLDATVLAVLVAWTGFAFWLGRRSADRSGSDLSGPPPGLWPQPGLGTPPGLGAGPQSAAPIRRDPADLPAEVMAEIRRELTRGNKLVAIKLMRDATGIGLKEAKDAVEAMQE